MVPAAFGYATAYFLAALAMLALRHPSFIVFTSLSFILHHILPFFQSVNNSDLQVALAVFLFYSGSYRLQIDSTGI